MGYTKNNNILIDIDTIFDTRLPILYTLDRKLTADIVKAGEYRNRLKNDFRHIPNDIFEAFYKTRTKAVLEIALQTDALTLIAQYCSEAYANNYIETKDHPPVNVYLNIYPYKLHLGEQEILKALIEDFIPADITVIVVNMNNLELTPNWVLDNVGTIFKYDGLDWLELHNAMQTITSTPLMDVMLIAPGIVPGTIPAKDVDNKMLETMVVSANTLINLYLIRTHYFSAIE